MDGYLFLARQAIRAHMALHNATSFALADVLNIEVATFYAKLNGHRRFTVNELNVLARDAGIKFPPLDADTRRITSGKVGGK